MAAFKTGFKLLMGVALIANFVDGQPAFAAESRFGLMSLLVADASTTVTEPEVKTDETEKTNANTNILKETFKKLVGKDDDKKDPAATGPEKTTTIQKADSKPQEEPAPSEEKPKEGLIKKALNTLINNKSKEDEKKEKEEEAAKQKAATLTGTDKTKPVEGEPKAPDQEQKTSDTAKKFISDTIDKIVDTVKGDIKDLKEGGSKGEEQAKVESTPKPEAVTPPQPPKVKSELAAKKDEVQDESKKNTNPLKEAFEKLVGKNTDKTDKKEETPEAAAEKK